MLVTEVELRLVIAWSIDFAVETSEHRACIAVLNQPGAQLDFGLDVLDGQRLDEEQHQTDVGMEAPEVGVLVRRVFGFASPDLWFGLLYVAMD